MNKRMRCYFTFIVLWIVSTVIAYWTTNPDRNYGITRLRTSTGERAVKVTRNPNFTTTGILALNMPFGRMTNSSKLHEPVKRITITPKVIRKRYISRSKRQLRSKKKRVNRFDTEIQYFTPRKTKVNHLDAQFLISNEKFCEESTPFLLVMVPSIQRNAAVRDAIRNTYGSYKQHGNLTVKLVFLFGTSSESSDRDIQQESIKYGDIIQTDFIDSYKNLTYKILYGLKWVSLHCSQAKFVLKSDEDVFVYMPVLLDFLIKKPYGDEGAIYGHVYGESSVQRVGKWAVTHEQYPLQTFPPYASGTCYAVSGNIVSRLLMTSEHMPYVPIEDAFITGCLTKIIGAKQIHNLRFSQWKSAKPIPCKAVRNRQISTTKTTLSLYSQLWEALNHFDTICGKKYSQRFGHLT